MVYRESVGKIWIKKRARDKSDLIKKKNSLVVQYSRFTM